MKSNIKVNQFSLPCLYFRQSKHSLDNKHRIIIRRAIHFSLIEEKEEKYHNNEREENRNLNCGNKIRVQLKGNCQFELNFHVVLDRKAQNTVECHLSRK